MPHDIEQLLPHLEERGAESRREAEAALAKRGKAEADSIRRTLEEQRKRVAKQLAGAAQMVLIFQADDERRQFERDRRYWERWLTRYDEDIRQEPARVQDFYTVSSSRLEPIGIAYLWPVTG
jgi:HPt (histidine-containing phosphotransfer) domain-containing protein